MNTEKRREYTHIANYIHNDLGLTKEVVIDIVHKRVDAVLEDLFSRWVLTNTFDHKVRAMVAESLCPGIRSEYAQRSYQGVISSRVSEEIKRQIAEEVTSRIDFSGLEIVKKP